MLEQKIKKLEKLEFQMFVLDELAEDLEKHGQDIIRLTLGKSTEELNKNIIKKYHEAIDDVNMRNIVYPEGIRELRNEIANWYKEMGNDVDKDDVIINTGTSPFFKDLMSLLVNNEDDEILMPYPYYSVYYVSAILAGAKVKFYNIDEKDLTIDMASFKVNYNPSKTKLVIMCSPGNPYGNLVSEKEFREILNIVKDPTFILSDEIYRNVSFIKSSTSILDVAKDKRNIIISNSFSKGFRMYTARVGFVILPKKIRRYFRVLLQHTLLTTNPVEQYAALEALKQRKDVDKLTTLYSQRNEYAHKKLSTISNITAIKAQGGFYCVINCHNFMSEHKVIGSSDLAKDILIKTGVAVVPGIDFGLDDCLRLSFTSCRFEEAIDRLSKYFNGSAS